jgi:hypothetical protein
MEPVYRAGSGTRSTSTALPSSPIGALPEDPTWSPSS